LINPFDRLAFALRIPPPGDALLETTGRRTGRPRITPVCDGTEGDTFWIMAQHGRSADYVRNIEANRRVRVKGSLSRTGWRPAQPTSSTTTIPRSACGSSVAAIAGAASAYMPREPSRRTR
jgi:deazaflavin-dependent oxidoreductase (nitroreductase family)